MPQSTVMTGALSRHLEPFKLRVMEYIHAGVVAGSLKGMAVLLTSAEIESRVHMLCTVNLECEPPSAMWALDLTIFSTQVSVHHIIDWNLGVTIILRIEIQFQGTVDVGSILFSFCSPLTHRIEIRKVQRNGT